MTDRQITHAPGCWGWGPRHYECALREIELLVAEWKRVTAAQGEYKARTERLVEVLELARAVLAQSIAAGHNVPGPAPEEIEKAFWALDVALKEVGNERA